MPSTAIIQGDMPPPLLPEGVGSRRPPGPFCIPLRMSSSPMFTSLAVHLSKSSNIRRESRKALGSQARIADTRISHKTMRHQATPNEQNDNCAKSCGDEAGALIGSVPADCLTYERGKERACDAETD